MFYKLHTVVGLINEELSPGLTEWNYIKCQTDGLTPALPQPHPKHTLSQDLYVTILFPNIIQGISNNAGFQGYPRSQHHNWDFQNGSLRGLVMILIITVEIIISPSSTFSLQLHVQVHSRRKHVWAMKGQLGLDKYLLEYLVQRFQNFLASGPTWKKFPFTSC